MEKEDARFCTGNDNGPTVSGLFTRAYFYAAVPDVPEGECVASRVRGLQNRRWQ